MALVKARDEEIPVLSRELTEDDARLHLRRLVEATVHALERLAGRADCVAAPGALLFLRPAVGDGVVAVARDDLVDVAGGIAPASEAGAVDAPIAQEHAVQPRLRRRIGRVDRGHPTTGVAGAPPEGAGTDVLGPVRAQPRLADVHLLGLPVETCGGRALAGSELDPARVREVLHRAAQLVGRPARAELRERGHQPFGGPPI